MSRDHRCHRCTSHTHVLPLHKFASARWYWHLEKHHRTFHIGEGLHAKEHPTKRRLPEKDKKANEIGTKETNPGYEQILQSTYCVNYWSFCLSSIYGKYPLISVTVTHTLGCCAFTVISRPSPASNQSLPVFRFQFSGHDSGNHGTYINTLCCYPLK